ncbi:MAG TPA: hypothetical protein VHM02_10445, partial [Thermoanaerobaculia bacterium]|nr:hypothetical protein [Thermoanaerobaculia bacterium]
GDAAPAVERARRAFADQGVLVRDVSRGPGLAGCLRVSIGPAPALRAVARAVEAIAAERLEEGA